MQRRQYLAGVAATSATALAGCAGVLGSNEFGAAAEPWSNDTDTELPNGYEYAGTVTLPTNRYTHINIAPAVPFTLALSASASAPMDFYVLGAGEFDRYRDQQEFAVYENTSAVGATAPQFSSGFNPGEYNVVFDNTAFAGSDPSGEVEADYTVRVTG